MDDLALARWRMNTLRLSNRRYPDAESAIGGLLGVQAENYTQSTWSVAARTTGMSASEFDRIFDEGAVLRTHVLRPTWHFVLPEDIRWLIELTAPRVRRAFRQAQRELGVDDSDLDRSAETIVTALSAGKPMTRDELRRVLEESGFPTEGLGMALLLTYAELSALICSGPRRDGSQTYALLDERAPESRSSSREEAVVELTRRYFTGHGPATERDLTYWATMTVTDVRSALAELGDTLESLEHDGRTYWFGEHAPDDDHGATDPRGHLLLILDEYYRGYQDSRHLLDVAGLHPRGRLSSLGMALLDGQMVGHMSRSVGTGHVMFEIQPFRDLGREETGCLEEAAVRHGEFLGLESRTVFVS